MMQVKGDYSANNVLKEGKILEIIENMRNRGNKIGLCVGAFDVLHPGHLTHLNSAKKHCDALVIGITSDKYVSKRRSKGRPVFNEQLRAFSVSQIKAVDYVFISNYKTANEAIMQLKPDFYIKGPDYKNDFESDIISERESIKKVGGRIVYTEDEKLSTSEIIEHIKALE